MGSRASPTTARGSANHQPKPFALSFPSSAAMTGGNNSPPPPPPPPTEQKSSTTTTTVTHSLGTDHPPSAMTSGRKRRRQLRRGKPHRVPPIHKLGEDLLLEIFLRLPSLAMLLRTALTCRAWRHAVACSSSFRRHFRAVHSPPLLGLFFDALGTVQAPNTPDFPTFVPARRRDRDLTAAVRGGDFFLTSLDERPDEAPCWSIVDCCRGFVLLMNWERPDEAPCWSIVDCCRGFVLLMNWDDASLVLFNPLTRQGEEDAFDLGPDDIFDGSRGHYVQMNPRLLFSDEDPKIVLCGMLQKLEDTDAFVVFTIFDGTGSIKCRTWENQMTGKNGLEGCSCNDYLIVNGTVFYADGLPNVQCLSIRRVVDFNDVTYHFLQVLHTTIQIHPTMVEHVELPQRATEAADEIEKEWIICLLADAAVRQSENGASFDQLLSETGIVTERLRVLLEALLADGLIYNTVDYGHYKLADN